MELALNLENDGLPMGGYGGGGISDYKKKKPKRSSPPAAPKPLDVSVTQVRIITYPFTCRHYRNYTGEWWTIQCNL